MILDAARTTFSVMFTVSQTPDYDAFGDPAIGGRARTSGTRRARNMAVAVFWSVALLLIAGRVYQHETIMTPQAHVMALAAR